MPAEEVFEGERPSSRAPFTPLTPQGRTIELQPHAGPTPHGILEDAEFKEQDKIRAKVAEKMNPETLLCPFANFVVDYGPVKVEADEIRDCRTHLIRRRLLVRHGDVYRWKYYAQNPSAMGQHEPKVFNDIKKLIDAIFLYVATKTVRGRGNNYVYEMLPHKPVRSDIPGANQKMDASILEPNGEKPDGLFDGIPLPIRFSIVPDEFKPELTIHDRKKVREQIVGNVHHIMCEDPRRRFMFAITAEDTRMTVWYFSRSHSVKAFSFDWVEKDIDKFIHVFLAFAFATPEELGIDPFVHKARLTEDAKLEEPESAQQYIYEYPEWVDPDSPGQPKSKFFKTVQALSASRPYCLSGRATRIWEVVEIDGLEEENAISTENVVLKDVWLDQGRQTEVKNMENIFDAVDELISKSKDTYGDNWLDLLLSKDTRFTAFDDDTKATLKRLLSDDNYKSLFLTKLHAWEGEPSKTLSAAAQIPNDDIFLSEAHVENFKDGLRSRVAVTTINSTKPALELLPGPAEADPKPKKARHYVPKRPCRFVYKEVCSRLFEVGTLGAFMDVILQATAALQILFCAGWMHRDISSGNLLVFNDNGTWRLKLADLEFAVPITYTEHKADPRTGTPYFMPYEIIKGKHVSEWIRLNTIPEQGLAMQVNILGNKKHPMYRQLKGFRMIPGYRVSRVKAIPENATNNVPQERSTPRYTFQHDLEALWWIVMYFIGACVPYPESRLHARQIFSQSITKVDSERADCFAWNFKTQYGLYLYSSISEAFTQPMEKLRCRMIEQYMARQVFGLIDDPGSYSLIHNDFAAVLRDLIDGIVPEEDEDEEDDDEEEEEETVNDSDKTGEGNQAGGENNTGADGGTDEEEPVDWRTIPLSPPRELTGAITCPVRIQKRPRKPDEEETEDNADKPNPKRKKAKKAAV